MALVLDCTTERGHDVAKAAHLQRREEGGHGDAAVTQVSPGGLTAEKPTQGVRKR